MALSTYADLQTAVTNWLHRADLTSIIPDLILLGEIRIFREVRCKPMESALSVTISSGVATVPSDYLELKNAYISGSTVSPLRRGTSDYIYTRYPTRSSDAKPRYIAREGSNFIFGPYPDSGYTVAGIYYASPTSIQSSANALFVAYPDLYLFAALCEAAPYLLEDPRVPLWEQKYASIKESIRQKEFMEDGSGSGLEVVAA